MFRTATESSIKSSGLTSQVHNWPVVRGSQEPNLSPQRQRTQADQDQEDDKAQKKAQRELEKLWMDRLQLISVITTFFAANEAQLLSTTTPSQGDLGNATEQAANATLMGALVFHSFAAILSFTASFVLVHFRLQEAKQEQKNPSLPDKEKHEIWCRDPHVAIQRVGYRQQEPPMHLLQRFHLLCVCISVLGFILFAVGILCYSFAMQATSVSIFSSACLAVCVVAGLAMLFVSSPGE